MRISFCPFLLLYDKMALRLRLGDADPDRMVWKKAHQLYVEAFHEPQRPMEKKKLGRIITKPINENVKKELFEYDAFLRGLGRMSLSKQFVS